MVLKQMGIHNRKATMDDTGIVSFVGIANDGSRMVIDGTGNYPYGLILLEFILWSVLPGTHPTVVNMTASIRALLVVLGAECWEDAEEEGRELFTVLKRSKRLEEIRWRREKPAPTVP